MSCGAMVSTAIASCCNVFQAGEIVGATLRSQRCGRALGNYSGPLPHTQRFRCNVAPDNYAVARTNVAIVANDATTTLRAALLPTLRPVILRLNGICLSPDGPDPRNDKG